MVDFVKLPVHALKGFIIDLFRVKNDLQLRCYQLTVSAICYQLTVSAICYQLTVSAICYQLTVSAICYQLNVSAICLRFHSMLVFVVLFLLYSKSAS